MVQQYVYEVVISDENVEQTLQAIDQRLQTLGQNTQQAFQRVQQGMGQGLRQSAGQADQALRKTAQSSNRLERELVRLIKTFPQERREISQLIRTHGSFNAVIGQTDQELSEVQQEFLRLIRANPQLRREVQRLMGQFDALNATLNANRQSFVRESDVLGASGLNPDRVRRAGFALQRFGVTGAAAFGEIVSVAGAAGIAIGAVLVTVNTLSRALGALARIAVDAFKRAARGSLDLARDLDIARAQFTAFFDGDTRLAEAALTRLRDLSVELGQNVVEIGRAFLPEVESLDQLERITRIAAALVRLQPEQGIAGARRSLQEILTEGQARSLVRQYEFAPAVGQAILDAFREGGIDAAITVLEDELERAGRSADDLADTFNVALGQIQQRIERLGEIAGEPIMDELAEQMSDVSHWAEENEEDLQELAQGFGDLVARIVDFIGTNVNEILRDLDPQAAQDVLETLGELERAAEDFITVFIGEDGQKLVAFIESLPDKIDEVAYHIDRLAERVEKLGLFFEGFGGGFERRTTEMIQGQIAAADSTEDLISVLERMASISDEIDFIDVFGEDIRPAAKQDILLQLVEGAENAEAFAAALEKVNERMRELGADELRIGPETDDPELLQEFFNTLQQIERAGTAEELADVWSGVNKELRDSDDLSVALFRVYLQQLALATDSTKEFEDAVRDIGSRGLLNQEGTDAFGALFGSGIPGFFDSGEIRDFYREARRGAEQLSESQEDLADATDSATDATDDQTDAFLELEQATRRLEQARQELAEAQEKVNEEEADFSYDVARRQAEIIEQNNRDLADLETELSRKRGENAQNLINALDAIRQGLEQSDTSNLGFDVIEQYGDIGQKIVDKLRDAFTKFRNDERDEWTDFERTLEDIDLKGTRKRLDIERDAAQKRLELERDYQSELAEIRRKADQAAFEAALQNDALELRRIRRREQFDLEEAGIGRDEDEEDIGADAEAQREELRIELEREREDAKTARERKLADLRIHLNDQYDMLIEEARREQRDLEHWEERKREDIKEELKRRQADFLDWVKDKKRALDKSLEDERQTIIERQTEIAQLELQIMTQRLRNWQNFFAQRAQLAGGGAGTPYSGPYDMEGSAAEPGPSISELREAAMDTVNEALASGLIHQHQYETLLGQIPDMTSGQLRTLITQLGGVIPRRFGGPVTPDYTGRRGMPYLVGEAGPELFVPNEPGQIISNDILQRLMYSPPGAMIGGGGSIDNSRNASVEVGLRMGLSPVEKKEVEIIAGNTVRRILA